MTRQPGNRGRTAAAVACALLLTRAALAGGQLHAARIATNAYELPARVRLHGGTVAADVLRIGGDHARVDLSGGALRAAHIDLFESQFTQTGGSVDVDALDVELLAAYE